MSQTSSRPSEKDKTRHTQTVVKAAHLVVCEHGHCRMAVVVGVEASVAVALERLFLHVWQESLGSARVAGIVRGLLERLSW